MEYKPERLADTYIRPSELRGKFEIDSLFDANEEVLIDLVVESLRKAQGAARDAGYSDVTLTLSADLSYGYPSLDWELRGSRMETAEDVEARKRSDEHKRKRAAKAEEDERELFQKLRAKYGDK